MNREFQAHLLEDFELLPKFLKKQLNEQLSRYGPEIYWKQKECLQNKPQMWQQGTAPKHLISRGPISDVPMSKIGVVFLAGGQGTRLGFPGPKGCFSFPRLGGKSLFEILLSRCKKAGRVAVMTSPQNHWPTLDFMKKHSFFGLEQFDLFKQSMLPLMDKEGNWFLRSPGCLAEGASGNGEVFKNGADLFLEWKKRGIEWVQILPIDNPLAEPFEIASGSDLVIVTTKRRKAEKVGLLVEKDQKIAVAEYTENQLGEDYDLAYLGMFSCHMSVVEKAICFPLPLHAVWKKGKKLTKKSFGWKQEEEIVCKFETFIFDVFSLAKQPKIIIKQREDCFAPLKTLEGETGLDAVTKAFLTKEKKFSRASNLF